MNENFPLNKEHYSRCTLDIFEEEATHIKYVDERDISDNRLICQRCVLRSSYESGDCVTGIVGEVEEGQQIKKLMNYFFEWTQGNVDELCFSCDKRKETEEGMLSLVKEALANRPISVTYFKQEASFDYLNSPVYKYLREYVDYSMFAGVYSFYRENTPPIEITPKMLRCEFLYFDCFLSNPEVLKDFKGWGLVVLHSEHNKFNFDFFLEVVRDFVSGEDIQWRYLAFEMEPPEDLWNILRSMGKTKNMKYGRNKYKEIEFKRTIKDKSKYGETCCWTPKRKETARIGKCEKHQRPKYIYFYRGNLTERLENINRRYFDYS